MNRRTFLAASADAATAGAAPRMVAAATQKTFVLVHGAWHGGWCWREVKEGLRGMGHRVSTPTQTGVGERKHLLSKDITLDAFATDIINRIEAEEFDDVILVGHSFATARCGSIILWRTVDLYPLHQTRLWASRRNAAVGEEAGKLAVAGNSHRS